jgi:hypothetical protein
LVTRSEERAARRAAFACALAAWDLSHRRLSEEVGIPSHRLWRCMRGLTELTPAERAKVGERLVFGPRSK